MVERCFALLVGDVDVRMWIVENRYCLLCIAVLDTLNQSFDTLIPFGDCCRTPIVGSECRVTSANQLSLSLSLSLSPYH
jgi:hypothetical protein